MAFARRRQSDHPTSFAQTHTPATIHHSPDIRRLAYTAIVPYVSISTFPGLPPAPSIQLSHFQQKRRSVFADIPTILWSIGSIVAGLHPRLPRPPAAYACCAAPSSPCPKFRAPALGTKRSFVLLYADVVRVPYCRRVRHTLGRYKITPWFFRLEQRLPYERR